MRIANFFREREPTQGSIVKNVFAMTSTLWPNSVYYIIFMWLNLLWVSRLGPQAIAAVAIGGTAFMLLMMPVQGIATAIYGTVGELAGRQDRVGLEKLVKEILAIGWCLSLILAIFGWFTAPFLLKLIGADKEVLSLAITYLKIQAIGGIITFSFWLINEMVRAARGMAIIMRVMALMITIQIILDYLLILGNFGFPALGVTGAAISAVASAGIGSIVGYRIIIKGKDSLIKVNFKNWRDFRIQSKTLKEIVKIGGFDTLEGIFRTVERIIMLGIVVPFGTLALAAYEIGHRILRMTSMFAFDLAKTTAIGVSQNLGANLQKRAENYGWIAVLINFLFVGIPAVLFFFFTQQVIGVFTQVPEVLQIGINYLKITAFGFIFFGMGVVLRRAFAGAKDTRTPMLIYCGTMALQIGLALTLPRFFGLGINGIWIALLVGMIFYGLVLAILFKIGYWKPKTLTKS